jgi:hypothetical protein
MIPKNDLQTNTVDGAEAFERGREMQEPEDLDEIDKDVDCEQDEDECNCSDPGCPCGGFKWGTL